MYRVRIKIIEASENKLQLVKTLKEVTGLGLRDSKNIIDDLHIGVEKTVVINNRQDVVRLKKEFNEYGKFQIYGGIEQERNNQLLNLGLGESQEYVDEISDRIFFQLDVESSKVILNFALSKFTYEQLIEIFNETNQFIDG